MFWLVLSVECRLIGHRGTVILEDPPALVLLEDTLKLGGRHAEQVTPVAEERTEGKEHKESELYPVQEHKEADAVGQVIECHILVHGVDRVLHGFALPVVLRQTAKALRLQMDSVWVFYRLFFLFNRRSRKAATCREEHCWRGFKLHHLVRSWSKKHISCSHERKRSS